jgi:acetoacetyl-[acyl-carrier protein] synthase
MTHLELPFEQRRAALINSKGFGGNNATGVFLSPAETRRLLEARWGKAALTEYDRKAEAIAAAAGDYDEQMLDETQPSIYRFGEGVLGGADLQLGPDAIRVPGFELPVSLKLHNPFED